MAMTVRTVMLALMLFAALPTSPVVAAGRVMTSVKSLELNRAPTTEEIMAAGQLGGALYPTRDLPAGKAGDAVNLSFGAAMEKWNRHEYREAVRMLKQHLKAHPDTPWGAEAVLHLGCDAQYNGRYGEAQKYFESIVNDTRGKSHPGARVLLDKARLRLGVLKVFQNNRGEAAALFRDLYATAGDWRERTYAGHWLQRLARMKGSGSAALNCGNQALAALLERDGRSREADALLKSASPSRRGQSVRDLEEGAARYGYPLVARRFGPADGATLAAPAIVHLPAVSSGDSGHYWLLEGNSDDGLRFFDPQAGKFFLQTPEEFAQQWDGVALVKAEGGGGEPLETERSRNLFGGCCGVPRAEEDLGCPDGKCKQGPSLNGGTPNGSPTWTVNMVNMNFYLTDIPLWYRSPIGPPVEIQLSYNSQSAIAVHEPFGNKWQFNYASYLVVDTAGEVTLFMPDGRRDVYRPVNPASPAAGYQKPYRVFNTLTYLGPNLFELTLPEGTVYRYAIPAGTASLQPFLVEIRDTHSLKLSFAYDASVRLTSVTDAAGKVTTLTYDNANRVTRVTDPFGRHADFTYDADGNLAGIGDMGGYSSSFTYDANAYLTGITTGGGTWSLYTEPADGIDNNMDKYPPPGGVMWENYRITVTNPQGGKEEYYYDGFSSVGWYKGPKHYGSGIQTLAYDYTKDLQNRGELRSVTLPEGDVFLYSYDQNGQLLHEQDGHGDTTGYSYNAMGRALSVTRPNLQVTTLGYAPNGVDVTSVATSKGATQLGSLTLGYNATRDPVSFTDRMGATSTIAYNVWGQPASITDSLGKVTAFVYDAGHFLIQVNRDGQKVRSYSYDTLGRVLTTTDASGVTLTYAYNNLDDITRVTWPDGKYVALTYSPLVPHLVTAIRERDGLTTTLTIDSLKRPVEMVNAEGGVTKLSYDADGNITRLMGPNGGVTRYGYDKNGRLASRTEPDGSQTLYGYDPAGLLKSVTNGRGMTTTLDYDQNHNLTGLNFSDGTPAVSFQYDPFDRLTAMVDGVGTHSYAYDANSRLISSDGPFASDTISYSYDSEGRRTGVSVQGGLATTRGFDAFHRLTTVANAAGSYAYGYSGVFPLPATLTRPNGSTTSYQYDPLARLTSITHKNSASAVMASHVYGYGSNDLRSSETITGGPVPSFGAGGQAAYGYDAANKLQTAAPVHPFGYDQDGNLTSGVTPQGYSFTALYNARNQLVSLEYTDGAAVTRKTTYGYNGFGYLETMSRFSNGTLQEQISYVRDRALVHQERSSVSGNSNYTWGLGYGGGIGGLLGLSRGSSHYSYLYDGRGNVGALLDASQGVAAAYAYDPFGVLLGTSGTLEQPYRFSTKPYDGGSGLSYYGYRFYSAASGRWLTRDPLGARFRELNLYAFVGNNPLHYVDPLGLEGSLLGRIKDLFKFGKDAKDKVDTATEAANDALEAKEAIDDPNPKSGFTLLKLVIKNTCGRIPGVGSAVKKIMTGAVETVETAPGGVEAAERQADTGTINIGAANQMRQIEW